MVFHISMALLCHQVGSYYEQANDAMALVCLKLHRYSSLGWQ